MHEIELKDGFLILDPQFLGKADADCLLRSLLETTHWQQHHVTLFGKKFPLPRLTAWHAEGRLNYQYSGVQHCPTPWTPTLLTVKNGLEQRFSSAFNSVLLNRYRSGDDSVDWHADNESGLGKNPIICSLSLGATRRFKLKHNTDTSETYDLDLNHGSVLLMGGALQHHWQHKLPKSKKRVAERLNLTFRYIKD